MKTFIVFCLLMFVSNGHAAGLDEKPDGTATITLTKEEVKDCKEEGGCHLITQKMLDHIMDKLKSPKKIEGTTL